VKLIRFILTYSKGSVALAVAASIIGGLAGTGILVAVSRGLSLGKAAPASVIWTYVALCIFAPLSRIASQVLLFRLSQHAVFDIRMQLSRQILAAPLRKLEEIGAPRLMASYTDDTAVIASGVSSIPTIFMQCVILVGCLAYLAWLSWFMLLVAIGFIAVGLVSFQLVANRAVRFLMLAREEQDVLFGHLRGLTEGIKELKLHHLRRQDFFTRFLEATARSQRDHTIVGTNIYVVGGSWTQFLHFALLGLLLFAMPGLIGLSGQALMGYTVILLFISVPLEVLMSIFPNLSRAAIALDKIESLGLSLAPTYDERQLTEESTLAPSWRQLQVKGITHYYYREKENSSFVLGPIDLTLSPGELVFLVGGNGSGKTTLAKLLAGLYIPESGEIRLDGQTIDNQTREAYRQFFSVVFSDFYLFNSLMGLQSPELEVRAREYLTQLQLEHKVEVGNGAFSTIDLSQGQRKRLALLTAYLEDRPIYIFDEWAADQDPLFKEIFYFKLLPELKSRGKTVLVISHDDRYYHVADRIIKLDYGRLVSDSLVAYSEKALGWVAAS
jgi:putative pyoverdin transport system ATP-binding/permease protein